MTSYGHICTDVSSKLISFKFDKLLNWVKAEDNSDYEKM